MLISYDIIIERVPQIISHSQSGMKMTEWSKAHRVESLVQGYETNGIS